MKKEYDIKVMRKLPNGDLLLQFSRKRYEKIKGVTKTNEYVTFNIPLTKLYELHGNLQKRIEDFVVKEPKLIK